MRTLRDRRVLVTGGTRGIGLAIARRFAQDGAEIVLTGRDPAALEQAWKGLEARGVRGTTCRLDVTDDASLAAARERIHREAGRIDVLVNNAGVVQGGPFLEVPLEAHRRTLEVNVQGLVAVTHTFLPDLVASDDAHLVNLSSAAGLIGLPQGASYAASKWAVLGLSESLRLELAQLGHRHVGVTAVCASFVDTGMFEGVRPPLLTRLLTPEALAEKVRRAVLRRRPFVREPWLVKVTPLLKGTLPTRVTDFFSDLLRVNQSMETWRGRERPPDGSGER